MTDWIGKRVDAAQHVSPVEDKIAATLKRHLSGPMRERPLRQAELANLAKELLAPSATGDDREPAP
jgi:hypothetical protein